MITDASMGYETRLHIGYAINMNSSENFYFSEVATIDLAKVSSDNSSFGQLISLVRSASNSDSFKMVSVKNEMGDNSESYHKFLTESFKKTELYVKGNGSVCTVDSYGDSLILVPGDVVLRALKESHEGRPYRRYPPAIALLESIINEFHENIYCVLYGY